MFEILFCYAPLVVALLPLLAAIGKTMAQAKAAQRKEELLDAQIAEKRARTAALEALSEAKFAQAQNKIVEAEIKIETLKLKQLELERKLGINHQEFKPTDY